ncbi:MAG: hypothetical protein ACYTG0_16080 [Planctomycetota bacterium]|jgi:hypothetical protein
MITLRRAGIAFGLLWAVLGIARVEMARGQSEQAPTPQRQSPAQNGLPQPQFPNTYGPLDAARDAHQRGEAQRRDAIDRQLQLIDEMVWYSGAPYFERYPPSLSAIYAYGYTGPRAARRAARGALWPYASSLGSRWRVFEPWPLVPGDIYGYPYVYRVEQPLGHKVIWTGPNSRIYRPVYESDLKQPAPPTPAPLQQVEPAEPEPVPAPPPESGPREF